MNSTLTEAMKDEDVEQAWKSLSHFQDAGRKAEQYLAQLDSSVKGMDEHYEKVSFRLSDHDKEAYTRMKEEINTRLGSIRERLIAVQDTKEMTDDGKGKKKDA